MAKRNNERRKKIAAKKVFTAALFFSLLIGLFSYPLIPVEANSVNDPEEIRLIPGGTPFGVRFQTKGAVIFRVKENSAAEAAGLCAGDIVIRVNGDEVECSSDLPRLLREHQGEKGENGEMGEKGEKGVKIVLVFKRNGRTMKTTLRLDGGELGVNVRDSLAGIGTLSFYDGETLAFAGLGHGICETHSGQVLPLGKASISRVRLIDVVRGTRGSPGQLRGVFLPGTAGEVYDNAEEGIFGRLDRSLTATDGGEEEALPAARKEEVHEGSAKILCTVKGDRKKEYAVEIEKILSLDSGGKNFLIRVVDSELIDLTGGIVQGMSGSPIIQDGRIAGAVTHVLLDDPERGYGIFVRNMLKKFERNEKETMP